MVENTESLSFTCSLERTGIVARYTSLRFMEYPRLKKKGWNSVKAQRAAHNRHYDGAHYNNGDG